MSEHVADGFTDDERGDGDRAAGDGLRTPTITAAAVAPAADGPPPEAYGVELDPPPPWARPCADAGCEAGCVTAATFDGIPLNDFANGNESDYPGFFRMGGRALFDALRAFHAGTDRGELRAMLCEAWGPAERAKAAVCDIYDHGDPEEIADLEKRLVTSDLRGLAARESAPYYDPITKRCPHGTRSPHECRDGCEA